MESKESLRHEKETRVRTVGVSLAAGFVLGLAVAAILLWITMPGMMIVVKKSKLGFNETVAAIEKAIPEHGWNSPGTIDMRESLAKHGHDLPRPVKIIKLCQPEYAESVLRTDPHVACLMPCSIAVWESDNGDVYYSKMNTGLMGKLFGGNIARVMGGNVAKDEHAILSEVERR